jgi:predicted nucleic acid-binding protein
MIFVDTGAFLARWLANDQHHAEARRGWESLRANPRPLCTSNFVIDEVLTLLTRRAYPAFAVERAREIYSSPNLTILRPDLEDELTALTFLERYADQRPSFTDCVSFALMKRTRTRQVFGYDAHFELAGFSRWRG